MTHPDYESKSRTVRVYGTLVGNTLFILIEIVGLLADAIGIVLRALHVIPQPRGKKR